MREFVTVVSLKTDADLFVITIIVELTNHLQLCFLISRLLCVTPISDRTEHPSMLQGAKKKTHVHNHNALTWPRHPTDRPCAPVPEP